MLTWVPPPPSNKHPSEANISRWAIGGDWDEGEGEGKELRTLEKIDFLSLLLFLLHLLLFMSSSQTPCCFAFIVLKLLLVIYDARNATMKEKKERENGAKKNAPNVIKWE